jgi:hypothetical protein
MLGVWDDDDNHRQPLNIGANDLGGHWNALDVQLTEAANPSTFGSTVHMSSAVLHDAGTALPRHNPDIKAVASIAICRWLDRFKRIRMDCGGLPQPHPHGSLLQKKSGDV